MHEPQEASYDASHGSAYKADLVLAFTFRCILYLGICLSAIAVTGCTKSTTPEGVSGENANYGADQGTRARNILPPIQGGEYEKSDCAPPKPTGRFQ